MFTRLGLNQVCDKSSWARQEDEQTSSKIRESRTDLNSREDLQIGTTDEGLISRRVFSVVEVRVISELVSRTADVRI